MTQRVLGKISGLADPDLDVVDNESNIQYLNVLNADAAFDGDLLRGRRQFLHQQNKVVLADNIARILGNEENL